MHNTEFFFHFYNIEILLFFLRQKVSGAQYGSKMPGQLHYESLCFKAVNQSIGRAIRHSKDYAVLILADHRYSRPTSKSLLPEWIAQKLTVCNKYGQSISSTCKVRRHSKLLLHRYKRKIIFFLVLTIAQEQ